MLKILTILEATKGNFVFMKSTASFTAFLLPSNFDRSLLGVSAVNEKEETCAMVDIFQIVLVIKFRDSEHIFVSGHHDLKVEMLACFDKVFIFDLTK